MKFLNLFVFLISILFFQISFAAKAHEHGVAKLDFAMEGLKGVIHFESPATFIYGFEHEAKSSKDKKERDLKIEILKNKMSEMVILDPKSECTFSPTKIEPFIKEDEHEDDHEKGKKNEHHEHATHMGTHSEVQAEFAVTCKKSLSATSIRFAFGKFFPALKKIKVQAINGETQKGADIQNDRGEIGL